MLSGNGNVLPRGLKPYFVNTVPWTYRISFSHTFLGASYLNLSHRTNKSLCHAVKTKHRIGETLSKHKSYIKLSLRLDFKSWVSWGQPLWSLSDMISIPISCGMKQLAISLLLLDRMLVHYRLPLAFFLSFSDTSVVLIYSSRRRGIHRPSQNLKVYLPVQGLAQVSSVTPSSTYCFQT